MAGAPENHVIVLFGARGDLAKRMLLPALLELDRSGRMPDDYRIVGSGRHAPDGEWRDEVGEAIEDAPDAFLARLAFATADADDGAQLAAAVAAAREEIGGDARVLHDLSVPPSAMAGMVGMLGRSGLADRARIVVEKPFGHDLDSARSLNAAVHEHFDEADVFRIDHFLGKDALQELLALEPAWDRTSVQAVFVDVPETLALEGRGAFYEETGALRDMVSTHLLQVAGVLAGLRGADGRARLDAVRPLAPADVVRGQYDGYREEDDVAADSQVETFVAARVWIDDERWEGVPFLLRTGKAMAASHEVASLVLRGGSRIETRVDLADAAVSDPYVRLLGDALGGDGRLFTHADDVERLWAVVAPILDDPPTVQTYARGTWGPEAALALPAPLGWRLPEDG